MRSAFAELDYSLWKLGAATLGMAIAAQRKRLEVAEAALERSRELLESGSVTRSRLDELQAAVDITRLDLEAEERKAQVATLELGRQRALLDRLTIHSPIDGTVVSIDTQVGEFVRHQPFRTPGPVHVVDAEQRQALCLDGDVELLVGDDDGVLLERVGPEEPLEEVHHRGLPGEVP